MSSLEVNQVIYEPKSTGIQECEVVEETDLKDNQVIYKATSTGIQQWEVLEKTDKGYRIARIKVVDCDHISNLSHPYYPTKQAAWKYLYYIFL